MVQLVARKGVFPLRSPATLWLGAERPWRSHTQRGSAMADLVLEQAKLQDGGSPISTAVSIGLHGYRFYRGRTGRSRSSAAAARQVSWKVL